MSVETKEYIVLKRFRQPGEGWKEEGDTVELAEVEARYLLRDGKVEAGKKTSDKLREKTGGKGK